MIPLSKLTDPSYLRNIQYRDSTNLSTRAGLHERYSINPLGWHQWVFQQMDLPPQARVLEVGCGPAYLWQGNLDKLDPGLKVYLSDLSPGMLEGAKAALSGFSQYDYTTLDASHLPYPEAVFDTVIANHMLYHLEEIPSALEEIKRVLKPGGCLYAATNGVDHLKEILSWKKHFFPEELLDQWGTSTSRFSLENGQDFLGDYFSPVEMRPYPDRLEIDLVEPLLAYIQSYTELSTSLKIWKELEAFLNGILAEKGLISVTKSTGLFLAVKH